MSTNINILLKTPRVTSKGVYYKLFPEETDPAKGTATGNENGGSCGRIEATAGLRSKRRWCCEPEEETDPDTPEKHRMLP